MQNFRGAVWAQAENNAAAWPGDFANRGYASGRRAVKIAVLTQHQAYRVPVVEIVLRNSVVP